MLRTLCLVLLLSACRDNKVEIVDTQVAIEPNDKDADERDDLLFSSSNTGDGYLFYGMLMLSTDNNGDPRNARPDDSDATFLGPKRGVTAVGDQNQDGYEDILVGGNQGSGSTDIYVFYGAPS